MEGALLAEIIPAREAERMGIVNRVVPDAELDKFVGEWAAKLAAGPPIALQMTKRMITTGLAMSMSEALHWESMAQTVTGTTQDTAEAMRAFVEKRKPVFKGR
jgi:2-(1,2-epoxy-1,2-dihydrophenyl)acetyl-CoA isomerase